MSKIYVTSDTHFCHSKEFLYGPRGFSSPHEMNEEIIRRWNSIVTHEDTVYLLGDVMLENNIEGLKCLKQLNGTIYIALGNHDTDARARMYKDCYNVADVQMAYRIKVGNQSIYLSHYPTKTANFDDGKPFGKKVINLCGHVHTKDPFIDLQDSLIYHCELDAHNCYPVDIETAIQELREKTC